jgi:hypothetical protein
MPVIVLITAVASHQVSDEGPLRHDVRRPQGEM